MEERLSSRVKSDTDSNKLAGYLAYVFERGDADHNLDCIGPASVNQANKAVASARGILAPKGINIAIIPSFFETITESRHGNSEDSSKTGLRILVFKY
jgi:stage V sporulation protein SpoVS